MTGKPVEEGRVEAVLAEARLFIRMQRCAIDCKSGVECQRCWILKAFTVEMPAVVGGVIEDAKAIRTVADRAALECATANLDTSLAEIAKLERGNHDRQTDGPRDHRRPREQAGEKP